MKKTGKQISCQWCKKETYVPAWRQPMFKFCSKHCAAKYNFTGSNHYNWRGGRYYHADGYVYQYAPEHPNKNKDGYVFEHRLVLEVKLGRILNPDEHVHHLNGIKDDNRKENLVALTNEEHLRLHWKESEINNFKNAKKTWIKKGQRLSPETEFKREVSV